MELQKVGIKIPVDNGSDIPLREFIPVFHRWIQNKLTDRLLIDVADYSHVVDGPGVMLVAFEGNYAVDEIGGERGLFYYNKRETADGTLDHRLMDAARTVYGACRQLESESEFSGRLKFSDSRMKVVANDRLLGGNNDEGRSRLEAATRRLVTTVFAVDDFEALPESDARERLGFNISAKAAGGLGEIVRRVS